jgi:hypothetical protein
MADDKTATAAEKAGEAVEKAGAAIKGAAASARSSFTPEAKPKAKAAPAKKTKKKDTFDVDPDQFRNTNDWPLYTRSEYVRVKQMTENVIFKGKSVKAGQFIVVAEDGKTSVHDHDEFTADYEIVKGPHKREF